MANFYQLIKEDVCYDSIESEDRNAPEWGTHPMLSGAPFGTTFPIYILRTSERQNNVPDFFACSGFMVVSNRAKRLLECFSKAIEFLPLKVLGFKSRSYEAGPYWLVHHLCTLDCINREMSEYTVCWYNEKLIDDVKKLVFDERKLGDEHFFVPQGMLSTFVSDALKSAIEREGFTGLDFTPLEKVWH